MAVLSKDPRDIRDAYKEAVVDSLLGNLSARLAGRGEFYRVVYGNKPSATLLTEFIVPRPAEERDGDEEADPIRISAHGLDFQVGLQPSSEKFTVNATCALYVRILPTSNEVMPGGRLEATFPIAREVQRELNRTIRARLAALQASLQGGRKHPDWSSKSYEVRRAANAEIGLDLENDRDRTQVNVDDTPEAETGVAGGGESEEALPSQEVKAKSELRDALTEPVPPPQKWLRLEVQVPSFEFALESAEADATEATRALNAALAQQLSDWAESTDEEFGGKLWGYRRGIHMRPSHVRDWNTFLQQVRSSGSKVVVPAIDLRWIVQVAADPIDSDLTTVHVALENWTVPLNQTNAREIEPAAFHVTVTVDVPARAHRMLRLDRVKPSYRYNKYLSYPALGFNGGVSLVRVGEVHRLITTWHPRYVLPRSSPTHSAVMRDIEALSKPEGLDNLRRLVVEFDSWLGNVEKHPVDSGLEGKDAEELAAKEREKLHRDLGDWRKERNAIDCGIRILEESRQHWSGPGAQANPLGVPFEAWLAMNEAMSRIAKAKGYKDWRLFQLAFILASLPSFATRIPEFHKYYTKDVAEYSEAVTLLYFATGGGKSEAFLGLLLLVMFLDRLRGKARGVSALMRYPLRLLTLQQARRTFSAIGAAEDIRHSRGHPGEPFSLGFWVGGSNTPNWHRDEGFDDVPSVSERPLDREDVARTAQPYKGARERWLKLTACPFCGSDKGLALRRSSTDGSNALGHYCVETKEHCSWNRRFNVPTALPFSIVDEDIYDLAPTVLLGTVDKLSALGQSQGTIRKFFGMFGFAPLMETSTNRLAIPLKASEWEALEGKSTRLFPSFADGDRGFFDPYPALLIQDEAHLLDESLGTFSGLFESALEAAFDQLAPLLGGQLSMEPGTSTRRRVKVIAASATVSEPQRQMRNLYQRATVQFPHPGPDLYESFYAMPKGPEDCDEDRLRALVSSSDVESRSHWGRVYGAILTNGHRHTVAMAAVLGQYHLLITSLYERLRSGDPSLQEEARVELGRWLTSSVHREEFKRLIASVEADTLLTLVDLHRITITYVTNKKGGDQVIDTEKTQSEKLHRDAGYANHVLGSELISGAVSAAEIQEVVRRAEKRVPKGKPFPDLNDTLRSVVATSAISHGVDVEEFNAMFFAGMPSDIAEYIQASSRVGRTHVGFSVFVPVPQRHRDRFVLEIHDIFHRFLERMILPAAVDRWAEKALVRVMPSFFQEYVCGVSAIESLCAASDDKKRGALSNAWAEEARNFINSPANAKATEAFMEKAMGLMFSPSPEGKAYYKALIKSELSHYQQDFAVERLVASTRLAKFFEGRNALLRPMTSLRDVDQSGVIHESRYDAASKKSSEGTTARAMLFIRKGSGADIDSADSRREGKE